MANNRQPDKTLAQPEKTLLVSVMLADAFAGSNAVREAEFAALTDEAAELVRAAGGDLCGVQMLKRERAHSALFVGTGKAAELAAVVAELGVALVVFNHELTPTQERNLERTLQCRVLDRVGLILAIFAQRAQSQEGRLQVELAQLTHLSGRLVRGYGHLQSQKGGIGLKGPGETKLETDRRLIQNKINMLQKKLAEIKRQRAVRRANRMAGRMKTVALVGYTNAGKSSLFNRLSKADVLAEDRLFATLDTTTRRVYLNEQHSILLSDTVGFIRDLPHRLVAAFSATLEETALADVLLHVVDAANVGHLRQIDDVNRVLAQIGADGIRQVLVYNKIDLLPADEQAAGLLRDGLGRVRAVRLSVQSGAGLADLRTALLEVCEEGGVA